MIDRNTELLQKGNASINEYKPVSAIIGRAQAYAERRLMEQESKFDEHEQAVNRWTNFTLALSFGLFLVGLSSSVYENRSKNKLKNLAMFRPSLF